jgi:lysyl-tRNA synthetase class 2
MTRPTEVTLITDPSDKLEADRLEKMGRLVELGVDPWGSRFDGNEPIDSVRAQCPEGESHDENRPTVRAAGRLIALRGQGKAAFLDLQDWTGRIQVLVGQKQVDETSWEISRQLDLGDLIGVDGSLGRTRTGEITIFAQRLHFLTKSLAPPPEKYHGLVDAELRQRRRYLDLIDKPEVLQRFLKRTQIVRAIRNYLDRQRYVEVETPTLHAIAGGAAARPFITHHNALDLDLYLRIALELHLKRLLVGGVERVYEIGRVFRNEGIDARHNPEFTMLEAYQAYGNYETMMDLTEGLVLAAVEVLGQGTVFAWGDEQIDLAPPWPRKTYAELFRQHVGAAVDDVDAVAEAAAAHDLEVSNKHHDVVVNDLFELLVEPTLAGPVFVIDYPASLCPLTKRQAGSETIAERFELFIQGMELANAYTELNDPRLQERLFRTQLAGLPEEESMAKMDEDFLRALQYGMPPAGGLGVGIDRLVMLLTNSRSIRDVILFPLLRPEKWDT